NTEEPDETEEEEVRNLEVENFIWEGLNEIYLYKKDVPELADQAFKNNKEKENFFLEFENPEDLFYEGLRADHEDFSFLVDDYVSLENSFDGISRSDGMGLGLQLYGEDKVLAYVQYVLPNSPAEVAGIQRGDMF